MHTLLTAEAALVERRLCRSDAARFVERHCRLHSPAAGGWIPFALWPQQRAALAPMSEARTLVVLKARQVGLTWLCAAYALWRMELHPPAAVLLFSRREEEARQLLRRLRGMESRLPPALRSQAVRSAAGEWELANGSTAQAFSTSGARSYTGTLALVDEADFVPDLAAFLDAVKPAVEAAGQLFLVSTPDKAQPLSPFKRLYHAAASGDLPHSAALFLPWHAHPARTPAWYAGMRDALRAQRESDDDLFQEYPATPEEALRVRSLAARLHPDTVRRALQPAPALPRAPLGSALPGLRVFDPPRPGRRYVAGADPAQGNPHSDESAVTVLDVETGAQVAAAGARLPLEEFARGCALLSAWYNGAPLLVERNNHGHAVLLWLEDQGAPLLAGPDGRPGWLTTSSSKVRLWDEAARALRAGECLLRDEATAAQLASVEAISLRAPAGLHDDRAMALVLALAARAQEAPLAASVVVAP